jgi:hypothetical protein
MQTSTPTPPAATVTSNDNAELVEEVKVISVDSHQTISSSFEPRLPHPLPALPNQQQQQQQQNSQPIFSTTSTPHRTQQQQQQQQNQQHQRQYYTYGNPDTSAGAPGSSKTFQNLRKQLFATREQTSNVSLASSQTSSVGGKSEVEDDASVMESEDDGSLWDDAWDDAWDSELEEDDDDENHVDDDGDLDEIDSNINETQSGLRHLQISGDDTVTPTTTTTTTTKSKHSPTQVKIPNPKKWSLPTEILIRICSYSDPEENVSLMGVSRKTLVTLARIVYQNPRLKKQSTVDLFLRTIRESKVYLTLPYTDLIEQLDLGGFKTSDDDLFDLLSVCPNLVSFTIRNRNIHSTPLCQLSTSAPKLTHLNLAGCEKVEMRFLVSRLVGLPSPVSPSFPPPSMITTPALLENLNVSRTRISDEDVFHLLQHYKSLTQLRMTACKGITNSALLHIATYASNLSHLCLNECEVTDEGICALSRKTSKARLSLQTLELSKTGISSFAIQRILSTFPRIVKIVANNFKESSAVSPDIVEDQAEMMHADILPLDEICATVKHIEVEGTNLTDATFSAALANAHELEFFKIRGSEISSTTFHKLSSLTHVKVRNFNRCARFKMAVD